LQDCLVPYFKIKDLENNNHGEEIMQADTSPNEEHTNSEAQQNSSDEGPRGDGT